MALIGKQLGKQIPASTTGNQAIQIFGLLTASLAEAQQVLDAYNSPTAVSSTLDSTPIVGGIFASIDALFTGANDGGSVAATGEYLGTTADMLTGYLSDMPQGDAVLTDHQLEELRTAVSTTSVAVYQIDNLFSTSVAVELWHSIVEAVNSIPAAVASAVSAVAGIVGRGVGSFIGGTWYLWAAAGLLAFFYLRRKVKEVTP